MLTTKAHAAIAVLIAVVSGLAGAAPYSPPRTSDNKPDLQGVWTNASLTTLERNDRYPSLVIPAKEVAKTEAAHPQAIRQRTDDGLDGSKPLDGTDLKGGRGYNAFWTDPGIHFGVVNGEHRTSWIIDPVDGRLPYTAAARERIARLPRDSFDGPEARPLGERCIAVGGRVGPPMVNGLYNNNYQIVQTSTHVIILVEMIQHARIIRLDAQHAPSAVTSLFGDSIGRWDGDTLVVATTGFHPLRARSADPAYLSQHAIVTERFTRVAPEQLHYEFRVDDPQFYAQPWRGEMTFNRSDSRLFEYACHEGNYALTGVLAGARAQEQHGQKSTASYGGKE